MKYDFATKILIFIIIYQYYCLPQTNIKLILFLLDNKIAKAKM